MPSLKVGTFALKCSLEHHRRCATFAPRKHLRSEPARQRLRDSERFNGLLRDDIFTIIGNPSWICRAKAGASFFLFPKNLTGNRSIKIKDDVEYLACNSLMNELHQCLVFERFCKEAQSSRIECGLAH